MFKTQRSRKQLVAVLYAIPLLGVIAFAPLGTFVFGFNIQGANLMVILLYGASVVVDFLIVALLAFIMLGVIVLSLEKLFKEIIPAWIRSGEPDKVNANTAIEAPALVEPDGAIPDHDPIPVGEFRQPPQVVQF